MSLTSPSASRHDLLQSGLSLIELLVAIVLGLFVVGAIVSAVISSNRNFRQDEMVGRMQENGRYAMQVITRDLRMAGFWGPLTNSSGINAAPRDCITNPTDAECLPYPVYVNSLLGIDDDCEATSDPAGYVWTFDVSEPIEALTRQTNTQANDAFSCIAPSEFYQGPDGNGSDILAIKRVRGVRDNQAVVNKNDEKAFLRVDGTLGMLHSYQLDTATGSQSDWEYLAHIYYIRNFAVTVGDGIPTLVRKTLAIDDSPTAPNPPASGSFDTWIDVVDEGGGIAQGIEFFRVLFGIDTNTDGTPDFYISNPTAAQLAQAATARIFVLTRSTAFDVSYANNKAYIMGDICVSPSASICTDLGLPQIARTADNFYRRVYSSTVKLRNPINQRLLGS